VSLKLLLHLRHWCFFAPDPADSDLHAGVLDFLPSLFLRPSRVLSDGGLLSMPLLPPPAAPARGEGLAAPPTRSTNVVKETVWPVFSFM